MKRCVILCLLCSLIILMSVGCWDRIELEDLGIIVAMGIDKQDDQYLVSVQMVHPRVISGKELTTPVTTYKETGNTLYQAIGKISKTSSQVLHFSHLLLLVLSEEVAKNGIINTVNYLSRNYPFRSDVNVAISKGEKAADILSEFTPYANIPAKSIATSFKILQTQGDFASVTLNDVYKNMELKGRELFLPGIRTIGKKKDAQSADEITKKISPSSQIEYSGIGIFKKDKLLGWLNEEEGKSVGYIYELPNMSEELTNPQGGKGKVSIAIPKPAIKMKGLFKNGKPQIDMNLNIKGSVVEDVYEMRLTSSQTITKLEKQLEQKIKQTVEKSIKSIQEKYKSDIWGFGWLLHRQSPKEWKKIENNWDQKFASLKITIKVDAVIRGTGELYDPVKPHTY